MVYHVKYFIREIGFARNEVRHDIPRSIVLYTCINAARRHCAVSRDHLRQMWQPANNTRRVLYHRRQRQRYRALTANAVSWFSASDYFPPPATGDMRIYGMFLREGSLDKNARGESRRLFQNAEAAVLLFGVENRRILARVNLGAVNGIWHLVSFFVAFYLGRTISFTSQLFGVYH